MAITLLAPQEFTTEVPLLAQNGARNGHLQEERFETAASVNLVLNHHTNSSAEQNSIKEVWQAFKANPRRIDLRNRLMEKYLPIVKYQGERLWNKLPDGVELDDVVSSGVFGLMDAIDGYDLSRGIKFETYCVPRIRGAMLDELRKMDWVPRLVRSRATKLKNGIEELQTQHGRDPTLEELAEFLQLTVADLEKLFEDARSVGIISLNTKWYETDSHKDVRELDIVTNPQSVDPTKRIEGGNLQAYLRGLNQTERLILILRYHEDLKFKQIAEHLGVSESRVSQMHSALMKRIYQRAGRYAHSQRTLDDPFPLKAVIQAEFRHTDSIGSANTELQSISLNGAEAEMLTPSSFKNDATQEPINATEIHTSAGQNIGEDILERLETIHEALDSLEKSEDFTAEQPVPSVPQAPTAKAIKNSRRIKFPETKTAHQERVEYMQREAARRRKEWPE